MSAANVTEATMTAQRAQREREIAVAVYERLEEDKRLEEMRELKALWREEDDEWEPGGKGDWSTVEGHRRRKLAARKVRRLASTDYDELEAQASRKGVARSNRKRK